MRRLRIELAAALLSGCAFSPGDPWGVVELQARAAFAPPPERLSGERLLTSSSYAIAIDRLEVQIGSVGVRAEEGGAAAGFDPARPPPGYSLCHGGHCHADDGRLVSYEEIAAEVSGGAGGVSLARPVTAEWIALGATPAVIPLGECPGGCEVGYGALSSVEVSIEAIRLSGRVFDALGGPAPRLPEEGVAIDAEWPIERVLRAEIDAPADGSEPAGIALEASVLPAPRLFDGIDWAVIPASSSTVAEAIATNLDAALTVSVERYEPRVEEE